MLYFYYKKIKKGGENMSRDGLFSLYLINKLLEENLIFINSSENDLKTEKFYLELGIIIQDISDNFKLV